MAGDAARRAADGDGHWHRWGQSRKLADGLLDGGIDLCVEDAGQRVALELLLAPGGFAQSATGGVGVK
jgi:hypothetical protein